jgi:hypothetical protein
MNFKKLYRSIFSNHSSSNLYFVHRIDSNIGDRLSAPYLYYSFDFNARIDICDTKAISNIPKGSNIIVGGGGLMMPYFDSYREALLQRQPNNVVWWAVGERRIQDTQTAFVNEQAVQNSIQPHWFNQHHLVGFRQSTPFYPFLPCVSCKAVAEFCTTAPTTPPKHDVVFFEHAHIPLPDAGPYLKRNNHNIEPKELFTFLNSARVVVTNSYHGMYWSLLLGKQVVVIPFSSGLYHHPWPVHWAQPQEVQRVIEQALALNNKTNTNLLDECVSLNDAFYFQVLKYLAKR